MDDLFANLTPNEPSPPPEKRCIKHLLGLVNRGTFTATESEMKEIMLSEHEAKLEGLARHVLAKRTKEERRAWLDQFEAKHGYSMTLELKNRILELNKARTRPSDA